jgi:hypothetical protein
MSVGVMTVGVMSVGEITVGVMRRPHLDISVDFCQIMYSLMITHETRTNIYFIDENKRYSRKFR